jgi:hypothetical protein
VHLLPYHVNLVVILQDAHTEQEGEEELVLLKQRPTDIAIQAEREILVDIVNPLEQVICEEDESSEEVTIDNKM